MIVDAENPGNADESGFDAHFDGLAIVKTVEILARDGEAFEPVAIAPRSDDELMHRQQARHGEAADDGGVEILRRRTVERAVNEKQSAQKPGQRYKAMKNSLEQFDFLAAKSAALGPHGQENGSEENQSAKNEDAVEVEGRIEKTGNEKCDCAQQKNTEAIDKAAAHGAIGIGKGEAAVLAGFVGARE